MTPPSLRERPALRTYIYRGDRLTDSALKGAKCRAVRILNNVGKEACVCGRGSMLVLFDGEIHPRVVLRRQLRKIA